MQQTPNSRRGMLFLRVSTSNVFLSVENEDLADLTLGDSTCFSHFPELTRADAGLEGTLVFKIFK